MIELAASAGAAPSSNAAKVLGKPHPNLALDTALITNFASGSSKLKLRLRLGNLGDGAAKPSKARVFLASKRGAGAFGRRSAGDIALKMVRVPRIASGHVRAIRPRMRVPSGARYRRYHYLRIKLDVQRRVKEYDEHDNGIYLRLPQRPRCALRMESAREAQECSRRWRWTTRTGSGTGG